jgi:hypothetical protein
MRPSSLTFFLLTFGFFFCFVEDESIASSDKFINIPPFGEGLIFIVWKGEDEIEDFDGLLFAVGEILINGALNFGVPCFKTAADKLAAGLGWPSTSSMIFGGLPRRRFGGGVDRTGAAAAAGATAVCGGPMYQLESLSLWEFEQSSELFLLS